mmetsp:Transcript_18394/g.23796  ORF Transcript_18394/g.23796 Transcript_18394/m.23796 type:complete len:137 (-) Transcript_18394:189-599(-)
MMANVFSPAVTASTISCWPGRNPSNPKTSRSSVAAPDMKNPTVSNLQFAESHSRGRGTIPARASSGVFAPAATRSVEQRGVVDQQDTQNGNGDQNDQRCQIKPAHLRQKAADPPINRLQQAIQPIPNLRHQRLTKI